MAIKEFRIKSGDYRLSPIQMSNLVSEFYGDVSVEKGEFLLKFNDFEDELLQKKDRTAETLAVQFVIVLEGFKK